MLAIQQEETRYFHEVASRVVGGENLPRIAILYCQRIKDHSCIGCANCFQALSEKTGQFSRYETIDLVAMTDCGDCPGLLVPRVKLLTETLKARGRDIQVLHLGTCIKTAMDTAACPLDYDDLGVMLKEKFGFEVVLGTYSE